jgi:hypothetical protein
MHFGESAQFGARFAEAPIEAKSGFAVGIEAPT